ncbi:hypothetical protein EVAR_87389_1 [Eumeta japonica]|uniref:Reverse transcriptase domain-containing protein n=1 Tax=Eumeta variegata TaxID=151549 RepID=A0A4C1Y3I7_EUMVA|nr:hypothetical protein EVAR_87389_1 [Eumeta japonica]
MAVLLDMENAFDRVRYDGLIHNLLDTSLLPVLIRVVTSFLQRCSFCVAVDDVLPASKSETSRSTAGQLPISRIIRTIHR